MLTDLSANHDIHIFVRQHFSRPKAGTPTPSAEGIGYHFKEISPLIEDQIEFRPS